MAKFGEKIWHVEVFVDRLSVLVQYKLPCTQEAVVQCLVSESDCIKLVCVSRVLRTVY